MEKALAVSHDSYPESLNADLCGSPGTSAEMGEPLNVPQTTEHVTYYMVLFNIDQMNVRECLLEAGAFVPSKLMMSHFSEQLVDLRNSCLLRPFLFNEHQAMSPAFKGPEMLSFYFLLIRGPWSQPPLVNW